MECLKSPLRQLRKNDGCGFISAFSALRDMLLTKPISGEIRVKDADRFLKERGL